MLRRNFHVHKAPFALGGGKSVNLETFVPKQYEAVAKEIAELTPDVFVEDLVKKKELPQSHWITFDTASLLQLFPYNTVKGLDIPDELDYAKNVEKIGEAAVLVNQTECLVHSSMFEDKEGMFGHFMKLSEQVLEPGCHMLRYNAVTGKLLPVHLQPEGNTLFERTYEFSERDGVTPIVRKFHFNSLWVSKNDVEKLNLFVPAEPELTLRDARAKETYCHLCHIARPHRVLGEISLKTHLHPILSNVLIGLPRWPDADRGFTNVPARKDCHVGRERTLLPVHLSEKLKAVTEENSFKSQFWVSSNFIDSKYQHVIRGSRHRVKYINGSKLQEDAFYNQDQFPPSDAPFGHLCVSMAGRHTINTTTTKIGPKGEVIKVPGPPKHY